MTMTTEELTTENARLRAVLRDLGTAYHALGELFGVVADGPRKPSGGGEQASMTEWTAMKRDSDDRWHPVGTSGDKRHAENEYRDWVRDVPDLADAGCLAIAYRELSQWRISQNLQGGQR